MPHFTATFVLCDGPHSVCGVCFSLYLNKSTSYLSLCLSLNSFCDETSRTWALLGPETRYCGFWLGLSPNYVGSRPNQGFGWVRVPAMWVQVPICGKWFHKCWSDFSDQGCYFLLEYHLLHGLGRTLLISPSLVHIFYELNSLLFCLILITFKCQEIAAILYLIWSL